MLSKDALKTRCFRIWGICLLLFVIVLVCIVVRVARTPSEAFISVNFATHTFYGMPNISIEASNRMPFNVFCWIEPEKLSSGEWMNTALWGGNTVPLRLRFSLAAHSKLT